MPPDNKHEVLFSLLNRLNNAVQASPINHTAFCPHCRCYRFDPLLNRIEAGAYTSFSPRSLATYDSDRTYDLQPVKFMNVVRYHLSSLNRFADDRMRP